jgi:ElaB/YqjD/DUF883 family membrane-anchored ribosome-binding protein
MMAKDMKKDIKKKMEKKCDEFNKRITDLKKDIGRFEKDAAHKVRDYPMQSVAIAFGAGAVLGALATTLLGGRR